VVDGNRRFGGSCCFRIEGRRGSAHTVEVTGHSKQSVTYYYTTRYQNRENHKLKSLPLLKISDLRDSRLLQILKTLFSKTSPYIYFFLFNVYGSMHRKYIPIYIQQDTTLHSLFISENFSTCFGWYLHPSSGEQTTVSTASSICHTVTATCRYSGR
jgi:hypothetical protein